MPPATRASRLTRPQKDLALSQLTTTLLLFLAEGTALGWVFALGTADAAALVAKNAWPSAVRDQILVSVGVLWALTLVGTFVIYSRGAIARALRWGYLLLPVIPLALLPGLFAPHPWRTKPLIFLSILALYGLVAERCFTASATQFLPLMGPKFAHLSVRNGLRKVLGWLPLFIVGIASVVYITATGVLTVWNHHGFNTGAYDLAIFDNLMWNAMHGAPFRSSIDGNGNSLTVHAEIAMVLFVPFYAIHPSSEALLWIQAGCLGLGAIPLYLLAREFVSAGYAVVIALSYLLYAPMHGSQFYDFHWLTILPAFLFLNLYSIVTERHKLTIATTLLLWLLREDVSPGLMMLGLVLAISGYRVRTGLMLAAGSAIWFVLIKFVIMPSIGPWFFDSLYEDLTTPTEKGYGSVVKTLVTNPWFVMQKLLKASKLEYALHILAPVLLIPLRRLALGALLLAPAFFTIFTNSPATYSITYQYSAHCTGYVFLAASFYLGSLPDPARRFGTAAALAATMFCHSTQFGALIRPDSFIGGSIPELIRKRDEEAERLKALSFLRSKIPADASVIATTRESPHLSSRAHIYAFGHSQALADYVLIHPGSFGMGTTNRDILAVLGSGEYGLYDELGDFTLWKKWHQSDATDEAIERLQERLEPSYGRGDREKLKRR